MNKYIITLIIAVTSVSSLYCNEVDPSCSDEVVSSKTFYFKGGFSLPPGQKYYIPLPIPTVGIGSRYQRGHYGFDMSLNLSSLLIVNYVSAKGVFLYYPYPENENRFYFGAGPGLGFVASIEAEGGMASLEGIIGYEFGRSSQFKPFIQLEVTQPVVRFKSKGYGQNNPGVALVIGVGF